MIKNNIYLMFLFAASLTACKTQNDTKENSEYDSNGMSSSIEPLGSMGKGDTDYSEEFKRSEEIKAIGDVHFGINKEEAATAVKNFKLTSSETGNPPYHLGEWRFESVDTFFTGDSLHSLEILGRPLSSPKFDEETMKEANMLKAIVSEKFGEPHESTTMTNGSPVYGSKFMIYRWKVGRKHIQINT